MSIKHAALALLMCARWDEAFRWLHTQSESTLGDVRSQALLDAIADRRVLQVEVEAAVDALYSVGTVKAGEMALAWSMLTCMPGAPATFRSVLPQLQHALDTADLAAGDDADIRDRIRIWWRAGDGEFARKTTRSIFATVDAVLRDGYLPGREPQPTFEEAVVRWLSTPHQGPTLVVMPAAKATKLNHYNKQFSEILDKPLPLVVARNLDEAGRKLGYEFPHATTAMQALLRDLREDQPVRLRPTILVGPMGTGKSRIVRKFAEAIGIQFVFRYDGASSGDNHFGGTSKAWSNTEPSVPARAVLQSRTANPFVMIDEIDKAATMNRNTGSLWHSLLSFTDVETAARYRDQSLDAELQLSACSFIATANDASVLPDMLKDRFRIVRIPAPRLVDLPLLAASVMEDMAHGDAERVGDDPLAPDELVVIAKAWERAGFSLRKLQKIVAATLEARDAYAMRH